MVWLAWQAGLWRSSTRATDQTRKQSRGHHCESAINLGTPEERRHLFEPGKRSASTLSYETAGIVRVEHQRATWGKIEILCRLIMGGWRGKNPDTASTLASVIYYSIINILNMHLAYCLDWYICWFDNLIFGIDNYSMFSNHYKVFFFIYYFT